MKGFSIVVLLGALASSQVNGATIETKDGRYSDEFCIGKAEGDHPHPTNCHQFVSCTRAGLAYERDCAPCSTADNPRDCPSGVLVFDKNSLKCEWESTAQCGSGSGVTPLPTETPTDGPTETEAPVPETTTLSPTTLPPTGPTRPINGSTCDPLDCLTDGDCKDYWICDKKTNTWIIRSCGLGEFFVRTPGAGKPGVHGGSCQLYDNLSEAERLALWKDGKCLECVRESIGQCSQTYRFLERESKTLEYQIIDCGTDMVFDEDQLICHHCSKITNKSTGAQCCNKRIRAQI